MEPSTWVGKRGKEGWGLRGGNRAINCTWRRKSSSIGRARKVTLVSTPRLLVMPSCVDPQPKASVPRSSETRSVCRSLALLAANAAGLSFPALKEQTSGKCGN